jgi:uncharacterized protein (DUF1800 family)
MALAHPTPGFVALAPRIALACQARKAARQDNSPHLTGRFADMLITASPHPTMLPYLDQTDCEGPPPSRNVAPSYAQTGRAFRV